MDGERTADGLPVAGRNGARAALGVIAIVELVTLLTLLGNLATAHDPTLAKVVGPVHGTVYLLGIALACVTTRSRRARLMSVVPLVGAFLAWRNVSADRRAPDGPTP